MIQIGLYIQCVGKARMLSEPHQIPIPHRAVANHYSRSATLILPLWSLPRLAMELVVSVQFVQENQGYPCQTHATLNRATSHIPRTDAKATFASFRSSSRSTGSCALQSESSTYEDGDEAEVNLPLAGAPSTHTVPSQPPSCMHRFPVTEKACGSREEW